jgi:glycosyltransferase involved in cell wall biosynthesis
MKKKELNYVYCFAYYNFDSPSVRYRAKYTLSYFKSKHGINYSLVIPGYTLHRIIKFMSAYLSALFLSGKNSLIVIQRVNSNFIYSRLLKTLVKLRTGNTVYDIDDADYLEYKPDTIYYFARKCRTISAGRKKIAEHLSQFNSDIVHTTSPIVDLNIVKKKRNKLFTIGWIGGFGGEHKEGMINLVFPVLKELGFEFKLIVLGVTNNNDADIIKNYFTKCKNIRIEIPRSIDWSDEVDIQKRIATFDIGIATLLDTEIQKSKSGIKAKQYMNNGVPVLSSNLPENDTVIEEGVNGFFCSSPTDFEEKIIKFHEMSDNEYYYFSSNARNSIIGFNHEKYLADFQRIKTGK